MKINMVHVIPSKFQLDFGKQNLLNRDVEVEDMAYVDFMIIDLVKVLN